MSKRTTIQLDDVRYRWPGRASFGLSVPELSVSAGETVLLLGESGSGKSTLLSLICGTILADSGSVRVAGTDLSTMSGAKRDRYRAENIGVIFQQFNLLPFGTVLDNILLPLRFAPNRRKACSDPVNDASALCDALGLPKGIAAQKASNLSVGQQQRIAVARGLIGGPKILIADEPTSALDETSQSNFMDVTFEQLRAGGSSLLMVSHDPRLGARFDRVLKMTDIAQIDRQAA